MTRSIPTRLPLSTLGALLITAAPAWAQLAPQEVWDGFASGLRDAGFDVSATQTMEGDVLAITDLALQTWIEDTEGTVRITLDRLTFAPMGDGVVDVGVPPDLRVQVSTEDEGSDVDLSLVVNQTAMALTVSGTPDAMVYDYAADTLGVALQDLLIDGVLQGDDVARGTLALEALAGQTTIATSADLRTTTQRVGAGEMRYDVAFTDPETGDGASFVGALTALSSNGGSEIPVDVPLEDVARAADAGLSGTGGFAHQGGRMTFAVLEDGQTTTGETLSTSGSFEVAFDGASLAYEIASAGLSVAVAVPDLPLPVEAAMEAFGVGFDLPLRPGALPQDAALSVTLRGLTLSPLIWNLFDPEEVLPRDPATVELEMSAQVSPTIDALKPEEAEMGPGDAPADLNALSVDRLLVEAAGARLSGDGAFTFDNDDLQTFNGLPRPEGAFELRVEGANTLLDRLIAMGLVTEQDAMGGRMMYSMFTVPGEAPDSATARIEVNEQGHILANGQRIQ